MGSRVVEGFRTLHEALGRWYWFIFLTLTLITLRTYDHTAALFTDRSPFAESFIAETNTEGFILWHGGLTVADYTMSVVLLTLLYRRWKAPASLQPEPRSRNPIKVLRRLHRVLGTAYWFVVGALVPITVHTTDHIIAIIFNTSPLSDTVVANSINHEGFLLWHSILTELDYGLTVLLLWMIYSRWKAALAVGSTESSSLLPEIRRVHSPSNR